ncbi:protein TMEPAI-like [Seriola aureovittata]|nr:protein TMEPAI-like [Seriola aureovittata]
MNHTELQGRDVGCVLGLGADRLRDRSLLSAPRQPAGGSAPRRLGAARRSENTSVPGRSSDTRANGFYSCSCARPQNQGMDISELEFVQIIIILLVMTLMVVLIVCLLSHYWLPALTFLSRLGHAQRHQAAQLDGAVWRDSVLTQQRNAEVTRGHLTNSLPPFMQQQQLCRLQPTYPYLQQELINLPPLICLSDGEELLPYKGPCRLQLRPPEQQLELSRAAVRAPPNRTVFDRDRIDIYTHSKSPRAPGGNTGLDAARARMEGSPPSYSKVMGDYAGSAARYSRYSNNAAPTDGRSGRDRSQTVFHAGSRRPESKASSDLNS